MKRYLILIITPLLFSIVFTGCKRYLNVTPDGIGTIEYAFRKRSEAEKYLFTVYNNLPSYGNSAADPGFVTGDEFAIHYPSTYFDIGLNRIQRGEQNIVNPFGNYWDGWNGGKPYFQALRECNIFLDNVETVPDLTESERKRWIAEVKFLKAYYHFYLFRMYGPIPLIKESLPVSASIEEVRVSRQPVDEVIGYIVSLIDESVTDLPQNILNEASELGRITKPIALALKAQVLVTAASPLFNGNQDYSSFKNKDGLALFNSNVDKEKWKAALDATKAAIDLAVSSGATLYYYTPISGETMSDSTRVTMNVRANITDKWNPEVIWGSSNAMASSVQGLAQARITSGDPSKLPSPPSTNESIRSMLAPPLHIAEMFYSNKGVPIEEDKTYDYENRFTRIRTATAQEKYYIKENMSTVQLHFDREPRFYASLGFDGGIWYGNGLFDDNKTWFIEGKAGQRGAQLGASLYSITGYWPKKLVNYKNDFGSNSDSYTTINYPWPVIRLAELYLMYAEALNEYSGPSDEVYKNLDLVRKRAGLLGVKESWTKYARNPNKPNSQDGLRDIIRREQLIETVFEGKRYWNLRRWKIAENYLNLPIKGWDLEQDDDNYYRVKTVISPIFSLKDYLWPISEDAIINNPNLVQNPGW
ncbi:RagB/SusD family nutrient uptake outer membrane protein [Sphingobacterium cellulitidis]|uniref:RagB/SusD family nutrient uptake outer membrane protein n=1 Tax=Sphingobacterium cellulitidis TaxID=1768011 RepID=UPI000B93FCEE|nr:RagB/SusD family nutrient uptake outer membrane protein [Sphingobacterium cellulitidis]OYD46709.1 RagB/SusD family nutrient uptake outer membrane protein [Sphingobacterium cellulitidis]